VPHEGSLGDGETSRQRVSVDSVEGLDFRQLLRAGGSLGLIELAAGEGHLGVLGAVVDLLAGQEGSAAALGQSAPPLQHPQRFLDGSHIVDPVPVAETGLRQGQEGNHEVLLPRCPFPDRHHGLIAEDVLVDPHFNFMLQCENHFLGRPKVAVVSHQRHEAHEQLQHLVLWSAQFARVELIKKVCFQLGSLKEKPPRSVMQNLNFGGLGSCDVSASRVGLGETLGRVEEGFAEPEILEREHHAVLGVA
jgi:hypothetical protein